MSDYIIDFIEALPWQIVTILIGAWVFVLTKVAHKRYSTYRELNLKARVKTLEENMEQVDRRSAEVSVLKNDMHHLAGRVDRGFRTIGDAQKLNTDEMKAIQKGVARIEGFLERSSNGTT